MTPKTIQILIDGFVMTLPPMSSDTKNDSNFDRRFYQHLSSKWIRTPKMNQIWGEDLATHFLPWIRTPKIIETLIRGLTMTFPPIDSDTKNDSAFERWIYHDASSD